MERFIVHIVDPYSLGNVQWRVQDLAEGGLRPGSRRDGVGVDDIMLLSQVSHFENQCQEAPPVAPSSTVIHPNGPRDCSGGSAHHTGTSVELATSPHGGPAVRSSMMFWGSILWNALPSDFRVIRVPGPFRKALSAIDILTLFSLNFYYLP